MINIPSYIHDLKPYQPGKSSDPADFARYKAILSSNENNLGPSPLAMKAIQEAVHDIHLYPDPQGEQLTLKLSQIHKREPSEIILSNGLDGLLYSIYKAFTQPGDHVITNQNSFVAFNKFAAMNDVSISQIPNEDYHFNMSRVTSYLNEKTKIIYICNPNNPTGAMVSNEEIQHVLDNVPTDILVIIDEAYIEYAKSIDPHFPDSSGLKNANVLILRTFSKLYGLAGMRIGYGMGAPYLIEALRKVKLVFNPNSLAQVAARAALDDREHRKETLANNSKWMPIMEDALRQKGIRFIKSYANFLCTVHQDAETAGKFMKYMDENGILLRKLDGFGMPEGVRISIGNNKEMEYFARVLDGF